MRPRREYLVVSFGKEIPYVEIGSNLVRAKGVGCGKMQIRVSPIFVVIYCFLAR